MTSAAEEVPSLPIGALLAGRHRLERLLGQGAMGSVYEASGPDGERVAVKVVRQPPGQAGSLRLARFEREARLASSLDSPHIIPVREVGADEALEVAFAVMPLLEGEDAGALVRRLGPLPPATAVRLALQACEGLAVAHAAGVVHRDIKPSNLFLARGPGGYTVRVADFGVAKSVADGLNLTAPGTSLGSPMYMAPEQLISAKEVDARADVWALAMTLYELLAGAPAYHALASFQQIVLAQSTRPVPSLHEAAPWLDPGLVRVVHGALLRDLDARCPSVRALADALRPHAAGGLDLPFTLLQGVTEERQRQLTAAPPRPATWKDVEALVRPGPLSETVAVPDPAPAPHDPVGALIGQTVGDRYRLERLLGKGGMGAVYEAIDQRDGQRYALKVVLGADHDADARRRFVREAKTAGDIRSEHVVGVVDAATDASRHLPYIVMELLRGEDLGQILKDSGPLEPGATVRAFVEACRGLEAAHAAGIVHRDIKPANLFLHQLPSGQLTTKICDFGVAKQTAVDVAQTSELTQTGGIIGSPMYMSPEQARSAKHADHRTDIWSLAISLHQALSGQKPWHHTTSFGELLLAICTEDLAPLQDAAPWIDPLLADAVHRGIRRDPKERYASAAEFRAALEPFAAPPEKLTRAALLSLSDSTRNTRAPRATGWGASPSQSTSLAASSSNRPQEAPRPAARATPSWAVPVGVFAAIATVGLSAVVAVKASRAHPEPAASATPAASLVATATTTAAATASAASAASAAAASATSPPGARVKGRLVLRGTPTRVLVNGAPVALATPGELPLEGAPGDTFLVEVEAGRVKRPAEKITLGRDGTLSPPEIIVAGGPVATAPTATGAPAATVPVKPTAAPTAAPPPTGVKPREEF